MSNKFLDDAGVVYLFSKVKERDYQSDFELGYYDTITENDDESYTITRQTGYLVLDGVKHKVTAKYGTTNNGLFANYDIKNYALLPSNNDIVANLISNSLKTYDTNTIYSQNIYGISLSRDGTLSVGLTTAISTIDEANSYLVQNPISIQYKLSKATTEKVEANHYARYNQRFILEHNKSEAERSATEGKVVHEKELVDNYITETEINDKLYNYLKVNENGSVLLSSGPLQIFYTDIDFSIYSEQRPNNIINSGDLDVYFFDTGITCRDYEADKYYKYSFPAKSGTFAMTSDIPSALAIDSELSSTSTNSVQNKVINSALDGKANKTDITDMTYVVDSSDNAVSLETYGTGGYYVVPTKTYVDTQLTDKQDKLVSGTNIKTINGSTILGSGDITISGGSGGNVGTDPSFNSVIVEQTGVENTGVKLYANRQGDLYSIKRADTSVNRKILTNSDIDPSKVVLTNKQQKISAVTLFESLYVGSDYWKASITANSNSSSQYYMILSANAGEFHFECPAKYNLNLITNQLTRHTTIYAPSKDGTIALLSDIPTIRDITQLYKHTYEIENQAGDTLFVNCWSTQNTKIPLCDITRYAFSNIQVYNNTNSETIQVLKWGTSGFFYLDDSGAITGNSYTVINYYIDGEPTTY